jgi:Fe-S-cluster-containing hydrogenase component 2
MIFEMPSCGGCRTCEMACSFKHRQEFVPSISSIKIVEKDRDPGFLVFLAEQKTGQSLPCDGCPELETPLCLQYCRKREELEPLLNQFRTRKESENGKSK